MSEPLPPTRVYDFTQYKHVTSESHPKFRTLDPPPPVSKKVLFEASLTFNLSGGFCVYIFWL